MHPKAVELMSRYRQLGEEMNTSAPGSSDFVRIAKERAEMEPFIQKYEQLSKVEKNIENNKEILYSNEDEELKDLAKEELETLQGDKENLEEEILIMLLPKDELKSKNIIVEIRAGAGGDEAAIFAGDLFRMYTRFAETKRWKYEIIDYNEIGVGGYKEIIFSITGKDVYGHLKYESGVHRVQRIPVTESGGRIHTSTASVAVMPEADEVDVDIDQKDIRIDVYRSSGAGGQHVNKTDSAVRITHLSTGIVVTCQDERSQLQNRARAMSILRAKLFDMELQKKMNEEIEMRRAQIGSGDRAEKIRTYNYPQNRVTDHRINLTLYRLEAIMNGELDELVNELLMHAQRALLQTLESK